MCKYGFVNWSQSIFRTMFSLPQGPEEANREGDTDENPIRLGGCTKEEFESLLALMYPRYAMHRHPALTAVVEKT